VRCRGLCAQEKTPTAYTPGTQRLSMITTLTNKGCSRWQIIDGIFDSHRPLEFLELLIKDAEKNRFLILDSIRVHHSKPVETWLAESKERIEYF